MKASEKKLVDQGKHPLQVAAQTHPLQPPKHLSKAHKAIWTEVVEAQSATLYTASDAFQLEAYVSAIHKLREANAELALPGAWEAVGSTGQVVMSQAAVRQREAIQAINSLGPALFLTPQARQAIQRPADQGPVMKGSAFAGLIR
ncbi:P27 family phage terminase small subunit [Brevundimonas sp.]|uniref:P27 family phage terminase small subunit n=1 Tax=Brevundimonas sp. TaxID=1871086 RepID=UPI0035B272C9